MKVFLLAGQSNMLGRAKVKDLPAEYRDIPVNLFMLKDKQWSPFMAGQGKSDEEFGPEVSFGILMAKAFPGEKIGLVKVSKGGTSLASSWSPDSQNKNSLYNTLIDQARHAAGFPRTNIVGMIWIQGGADAKEEATAKKYEENFRNFIGQIRKDLELPNLPFVFDVRDAGADGALQKQFPHLPLVRQAKLQIGKTVAHTAVILNDGLTFNSDGIHYDAKGQIELGKRLYEAMHKILTGGNSSSTTEDKK